MRPRLSFAVLSESASFPTIVLIVSRGTPISRKSPIIFSWARRDSTSRRSSSSPRQNFSRNAALLLSVSSSAEWYKCSTCCQRSGSISTLGTECAVQPDPGQPPVSQPRFRRNIEYPGCFFHAQSAKEAHLHYLALPGVEGRQPVHCLVQRQQIPGRPGTEEQLFIKWQVFCSSSAFL